MSGPFGQKDPVPFKYTNFQTLPNPHFHTLCLDGVYVHPLPCLTNGDVADILQIAQARILRLLRRKGIIEDDTVNADETLAETEQRSPSSSWPPPWAGSPPGPHCGKRTPSTCARARSSSIRKDSAPPHRALPPLAWRTRRPAQPGTGTQEPGDPQAARRVRPSGAVRRAVKCAVDQAGVYPPGSRALWPGFIPSPWTVSPGPLRLLLLQGVRSSRSVLWHPHQACLSELRAEPRRFHGFLLSLNHAEAIGSLGARSRTSRERECRRQHVPSCPAPAVFLRVNLPSSVSGWRASDDQVPCRSE